MVSQSVPSPLAGEGEGGGVPPSGGRRGIFYGWYIVAAGSGIQFLVGALLDGAVGGYAAALTRDYGWTRSALSGAFSVSRLLAGFANYPLGRMIDRLGPRVVMRAGLILYALGFFLFARLDSLPLFYAASILLAVGSNVGGFLPITTVMVNWFDRYRARAISLSFIGYAFGGLVAPAVILAITHDWRLTSLGSGLAVFAIGLPLTFLMHQRPELRGLRIDGATAAEAAHRDAEVAAARTSSSTISFTAGEAVRTRAFWMIALGHGSSLLVVAAVQVHMFLHLTGSFRYSDAGAAAVLGLMTAAQIAGQIAGGYLGDRFSKRRVVIVCMAMHMVALLLVAWNSSVPAAIAFAVLHGLAWGTRGPLMAALNADYFGRGSFGAIFGISTTVVTLGQIGGPIIAGVLYDTTGSYRLGFTVIALLAGLGSVFFVLATRPAPPRRSVEAAAAS